MASCDLILLLIFSLSLSSYMVKTQEENVQPVPALYIFGDSTVDGGNNPPDGNRFGRDLNGSSTIPRRSTNGLTIAYFIATYLELPIVPPFRIISEAEKSKTGVNYGYAGAGMLPTNCWGILSDCWTFDVQLDKFDLTLANNLSKLFSEDELADHLRKSIFLFSFGINDYTLHTSNSDPDSFAQILLNELSAGLKKLYKSGARKFFVNNIWPLGCTPGYINCCNQDMNNLVRPYSKQLPIMLKDLESELSGSIFSCSDDFQFVEDLKENPNIYGITNTIGSCEPTPSNCSEFLYFDNIHTTQAANQWFALNCFNGTLCSPLNIMQLAEAIVQ